MLPYNLRFARVSIQYKIEAQQTNHLNALNEKSFFSQMTCKKRAELICDKNVWTEFLIVFGVLYYGLTRDHQHTSAASSLCAGAFCILSDRRLSDYTSVTVDSTAARMVSFVRSAAYCSLRTHSWLFSTQNCYFHNRVISKNKQTRAQSRRYPL